MCGTSCNVSCAQDAVDYIGRPRPERGARPPSDSAWGLGPTRREVKDKEPAMHRRAFVRLLSAVPLLRPLQLRSGLPALRVVSRYAPAAAPGMPGPYPGRVVSVTSDKSVDITT